MGTPRLTRNRSTLGSSFSNLHKIRTAAGAIPTEVDQTSPPLFLVLSALHITGVAETNPIIADRAQNYFNSGGGLTGLRERYGKDRTFVVPILANAALAKLVPWSQVKSLPFELATLPHWLFRFLNLPVVSYAIPALVAVGQLKYFHRRPLNPLTRFLRSASVKKSLERLEVMQPESGGFLEATPLTAFVTMSLASTGRVGDPVVQRGVRFFGAFAA